MRPWASLKSRYIVYHAACTNKGVGSLVLILVSAWHLCIENPNQKLVATSLVLTFG